MGAWTPYSGAAVISSATAAWQDLDLSSIVGSNVAVVVLEATGPGPLYVRAKGESDGSLFFAIVGGKGNGAANSTVGRHSYVLTKTDSSGVIQYMDPDGVGWTTDVFLRGFFVPSYGGTHKRDSAPGFAVSTSWATQYIYSQHRPPVGGTALFQHMLRTDANNKALAIRPRGESGDYWKPFSGVYYSGANACRVESNIPFTYIKYPLIADTDSSGAYDIVADGACTIYETYTCWSEWDYYLKTRNTIFTNQVLPLRSGAWLEVDLSPYCGQLECLAILRLSVSSGGATGSYGAIRTYGGDDSAHTLSSYYGSGLQQMGSQPGEGAILVCPTDSQGRLEAAATQAGKTFDMELLGVVHSYTPTAPVVDADSVSPSGTIVSLTNPEKIRFRLDDPSGSGIDSSTFDVVATDQLGRQVSLVSAGSLASGIGGFLAPLDGAGIAGEPTVIEASIDWPSALLSGQRYTISIDADNKLGYSL